MYIHLYVYMYMYIYIYICTHVGIYMCIYISNCTFSYIYSVPTYIYTLFPFLSLFLCDAVYSLHNISTNAQIYKKISVFGDDHSYE